MQQSGRQSVYQKLFGMTTTGNSNMAAQTGNTYISGIMIDSIEILTAILRFRPCLAEIKYFRFRRPYCYFWLSVIVSTIWGHFLWTRHGRKRKKCRWNFDAIYHSSRYISISGLGGRIASSGCRSFSQSLSLNSPWSKTPRCSWKRTNLLFLYLNSWGFFYPQAQHVCVKIEAEYEG